MEVSGGNEILEHPKNYREFQGLERDKSGSASALLLPSSQAHLHVYTPAEGQWII